MFFTSFLRRRCLELWRSDLSSRGVPFRRDLLRLPLPLRRGSPFRAAPAHSDVQVRCPNSAKSQKDKNIRNSFTVYIVFFLDIFKYIFFVNLRSKECLDIFL